MATFFQIILLSVEMAGCKNSEMEQFPDTLYTMNSK